MYYATAQQFRLAGRKENIRVPAGALFDLVNDVAETTDVAATHPDIVDKLKRYANEVVQEMGDGHQAGPSVRKAGFVAIGQPINGAASH